MENLFIHVDVESRKGASYYILLMHWLQCVPPDAASFHSRTLNFVPFCGSSKTDKMQMNLPCHCL
jgi:hypothetical protein